MRHDKPDAGRKVSLGETIVFVVGAGFSSEFGYPMARDLLPRLWERLDQKKLETFHRVIKFHHPFWDKRPATLPEIEELLTELDANEELLPSLRPGGRFTRQELKTIRDDLLFEIAEWFHEIHSPTAPNPLLERFVQRIRSSAATIISFNWDYELDSTLFPEITAESYGLGDGPIEGPILLKPHGSLNWYPASPGRHLKRERRETLWIGKGGDIYLFLRWGAPQSQRRRYVPWIVPPTLLKDFKHGMLKMIWKMCVDRLSVARVVYFLGYSLPVGDWHSRYILRCGFHNQEKGLPLNGRRAAPTGRAKVCVVNPDPAAFRRIESVVGWECEWIPKRIGQWLDGNH